MYSTRPHASRMLDPEAVRTIELELEVIKKCVYVLKLSTKITRLLIIFSIARVQNSKKMNRRE